MSANEPGRLRRWWGEIRSGAPAPASGPTTGRASTSVASPGDRPADGSPPVDRKSLLVFAADPNWRSRFQRLLQPYAHKWALLPTLKCGPPLLELVDKLGAQGVVLQYHSGQTIVLETLRLLSDRLPALPRFVMASPEDRDSLRTLGAFPPVFLPENAAAEVVDDKLTHAFILNQWLSRPQISHFLPRIKSLPALPAAYQQVYESLQDPEFSGEQVAAHISRDPPFTAQLLKVVNSAFFSLQQTVNSATDAVMILGAVRLRALLLCSQAFCFIDEDVCPGFSPTREWNHALSVADTAQTLARKIHADASLTEAAFTAGLLHDLGKMLIAANLPVEYSALLEASRARGIELWRLEQEQLGFTHGELGACLLGVWGVPLHFVDAVAWHHEPGKSLCRTGGPLALVHVADCLAYGRKPDRDYLQACGLESLL